MFSMNDSHTSGVQLKRARSAHEEVNETDLFKACETGASVIVKNYFDRLKGEERQLNVDTIGVLCFMLACKHGRYEIAKIMLKLGVDVDCTDELMVRGIEHAIIRGHTEIVRLLMKNNADINSADAYGQYTPTMLAIQHRNYEILHFLLDNADLHVKDKKREDVFDMVLTDENVSLNIRAIFASHQNTKEEYKQRQKIQGILNTQSGLISKMKQRDMLTFMAKNEIAKEEVYHFVFNKKHEHILVSLITTTNFVRDLKILPTGYDQSYPFFLLTVKENLIKVASALLEKGVDVDYPLQEFKGYGISRHFSPSEVGDTALKMAYKSKYYDMVDLLLKYGADPTIRSKSGESVIDLAKKRKDTQMIEKLVRRG